MCHYGFSRSDFIYIIKGYVYFISVSLYLCISVAVSGELFQIKNWFEFRIDLLFSFLKLEVTISLFWHSKSRWNVDVSNEDWNFDMLILKLIFELKKGYFWHYDIFQNQKFGLNVLLIWPWQVWFPGFKHETVCSHLIMLVWLFYAHILAYCA